MSTAELLQIHPTELQFPLELNKKLYCSVKLSNKSNNHVAFAVTSATHPNKYRPSPYKGVLSPRSSERVTVIMQALKESPPGMQCNDRLLVHSAVVNSRVAPKNVTSEMFHKKSGNQVDKCQLRVSYAPPRSKWRQLLSRCIRPEEPFDYRRPNEGEKHNPFYLIII